MFSIALPPNALPIVGSPDKQRTPVSVTGRLYDMFDKIKGSIPEHRLPGCNGNLLHERRTNATNERQQNRHSSGRLRRRDRFPKLIPNAQAGRWDAGLATNLEMV